MDAAVGILTVLCVISACVGFGVAGLRLADRGDVAAPPAWAALAGLGFLTWLAGWPVLAGIYSRTVALALLALGIATGIASRGSLGFATRDDAAEAPISRACRGAAAGLVVLALLLAIPRAVGALRSPIVNRCDDWATYYHFPRLLLESGGFIEPFNFRRLGSLGAVPFLQSYFWPAWGTASVYLADGTIGQLALWASSRAAAAAPGRRFGWRAQAAGVAALAAGYTMTAPNSSPVLLPTAGAIALLGLTWRMNGHGSTRARATLAGMWGFVAAWLIGFRTSNVVFPALVWLAGAFAAWRGRDSLRPWAIAALTVGVALLPWSLTSWVSSGTPLFPVFRGYARSSQLLSADLGFAGKLAFIETCFWGSRIWLLVLVGACTAAIPSARSIALQSVFAILGTLVVSALNLSATDTYSVARYTDPFHVAGLLFLGGLWLAHAPEIPVRRRRWQAVAAIGGLAAWLAVPAPLEAEGKPMPASFATVAWRHIGLYATYARRAGEDGFRPRAIGGAKDFAEAQRRMGDDARVVSAVSKPFQWSFQDHVVHTLDCVGQVSPPPGMPFFQGPEPLARYFRDLGYTHLAFTRPDAPERARDIGNCLYSRDRWTHHAEKGTPLYRAWSRYFLDFFANVEQLGRAYRLVYEGPALVVVDLRDRATDAGDPRADPR